MFFKCKIKKRMNYFQTLLEKHLYDYYPELLSNEDFINACVDMAEATYQELIEKGYDVNTALEYAHGELFSGLGFSYFDTLINLVEENFQDQVPEDQRREFCMGLIDPCKAIFQKYSMEAIDDSPIEKTKMEAELIGFIDSQL